MKWCDFVWFYLVSTFGLLMAKNRLIIIRKDLIIWPGTSQDTFIVPSSQCVDGKPQCESFKATQAIQKSEKDPNCQCVCSKEGQMQTTLYFYENSWKCIKDDILRSHSGGTVKFRNEMTGVFTFRVGQWSYLANLTFGTSGRCEIKKSLSSFLQCNGSWASLPLNGIYIMSNDGVDHYLQLNGAPGMEGRIIKMAIRCSLLQETRYVVFKVKGTLTCSNIYPITSSKLPPVSTTTTRLALVSSIAVATVTRTQHATTSMALTRHSLIHSKRTITSSPFGRTITVLDLTTSSYKMQAVTASPESAVRKGNGTDKNGHNDVLNRKEDGGVSVAVLATAVVASFLFGILLISIITLRKRSRETQRAREIKKSIEDLATEVSELELQPSVEQDNRYPETEVPVYAQVGFNANNLDSSTTPRSDYEYIWPDDQYLAPISIVDTGASGEYDYALPEMPVKEHNYYRVSSPAEFQREHGVNNSTNKNTTNDLHGGLKSKQRKNYKISDINSKRNINCDVTERGDPLTKKGNKFDRGDAEESTDCRRELSKKHHDYDTAGSIIPSDLKEDHVYDVLEGPYPNFDYSRQLTENRMYGKIEDIGFEKGEWQI